jgi:hypothetical protein
LMTAFKYVQDGIQQVWRHISLPNVRWKTPDDGQRNCPKHVELLDKNKLGKIGASVGFIKKKSVAHYLVFVLIIIFIFTSTVWSRFATIHFSSRTEHSRLVVHHCRSSSVRSLLSALLALFWFACVSSFSILVKFY